MSAKHLQTRHARSNAGKTDRTRVACLPTDGAREGVPMHCSAVGSLRSRR